MQGLFKTLLRPDREEDPEATLIARADIRSGTSSSRPAAIATAVISILSACLGSKCETCGATPLAARSAMKK